MGHSKSNMLIAAILTMFIMCSCGSPADTRVDILEETTPVATESIPETTISVTETEETIHIEPENETLFIEVTEPEVNPEEVYMLACVIYQEAGGDKCCDDCRRRVADVVLNRVSDPRFPDTIYEVLTERSQYGLFHWTGIIWPDRAYDHTETESVERAYQIAREVLTGQHSELYGEGYIWQAEFVQGTDNVYHCGHIFGK